MAEVGAEIPPNTMLMNKTSATPNGPTVLELAAALTQPQWSELEQFADKRLRRSACTPQRQRALALFSGQAIVHTAVEQFALGELGNAGGRKLSQIQRSGREPFLHALRGAINSLIAHALDRTEFSQEHLSVGAESVEPGAYEPPNPTDLTEQLELHELERTLFTRLTARAGNNASRQLAVEALREDCAAGHACGEPGLEVNPEMKRQVRQQARDVWKNLTLD